MLPMMMMRGMSCGGYMGGYSPTSVFMQPYSTMPILPSYGYTPSFSFMPTTYSPMLSFPMA